MGAQETFRNRGVYPVLLTPPVNFEVTAKAYEDEKIVRARPQNIGQGELVLLRKKTAPEVGSTAMDWLVRTWAKPAFYDSVGIVIAEVVGLNGKSKEKVGLFFNKDGLMYPEAIVEEDDGPAEPRIDTAYLLSAAEFEDYDLPDLSQHRPTIAA